MAASDFFEARWGAIRLWCSRIRTAQPRAVVVHSPAIGDDHIVQDHGRDPYRATIDVLFDEMPSEARGPVERFREFREKVARGDEEVLIHPIDGSMLVKIDAGFEDSVDEHSNVEPLTVTFIKVSAIDSVREASAGSSIHAGGDAVTAAAEDLGTLMDVAGIDSPVALNAKAMVDSWSDTPDLPTRQVFADAAETDASIEAMLVDEGVEDNLELWPVYVAARLLQAACRDAVRATTADTPSLFFLKVAAPASILGLVVRIYGGSDAEYYEAQVRALNDLVTVGGLLEAGTELAMPVPPKQTGF